MGYPPKRGPRLGRGFQTARGESVSVTISVPGDVRIRMIRLGISPTRIANRAYVQEVRRLEELQELEFVRSKDPRMTESNLKKVGSRARRLLER